VEIFRSALLQGRGNRRSPGVSRQLAGTAEAVSAHTADHRYPRLRDELGHPEPATADERRRRCGTARVGWHVAFVLLRSRDAGIEGSLRGDGAFLRPASGAIAHRGAVASAVNGAMIDGMRTTRAIPLLLPTGRCIRRT